MCLVFDSFFAFCLHICGVEECCGVGVGLDCDMSSVHVAGDMLEWKYRGKIERYTYILPAGEWLLVPRRAEEDSPKDNRNENREGCDCHIQ